jgi:hypothetical protein
MSTKIKAFDCVEMKDKAQQDLRGEYQSRKADFSSYFAFLEAKANESPRQREFWAKVAAARQKAGEQA